MEYTRYKTDETGSRILNIPYSEYINQCLPGDVFTPVISENPGMAKENTESINQAIDEASLSGATIYIGPGSYPVISIVMKSNVRLFIDKGAILYSLTYKENESSSVKVNKAVIEAFDASDFEITGGGVIKGQGLTYTTAPFTEEPLYALSEFNTYKRVIESRHRIHFGIKGVDRPHVLYFHNCNNIKINNVILRESSSWTFVLSNCNEVDIHNLVLDNHMHVANTDGIDIKGGENIKIKKCFIATADDGIVLKPMVSAIKNVEICDCEIASCANSFKIGTETEFDVENVEIHDCVFFLPNGLTYGYSGIAIESADGSNIKNITATDIKMYGISSPILVWLGKRLRMNRSTVGSIENVLIKNVTSENVELPSALTGCSLDGKVYEPKNVVFENIDVTYRDTKEALDINPNVPEWSLSDYPDIVRISHIYHDSHEESDYWDLPCYGLFERYGKATLINWKCTPRSCNERPEFN